MIPGIRVKISKPQKIPQTMGKHESKGFERKKKKRQSHEIRSNRIAANLPFGEFGVVRR